MMSPSSLLAKLDELKKWQQTQQERLLRQHQTRLEETEKEFSDYESIPGLSAYESFKNKSRSNTGNVDNQCHNQHKANDQVNNKSCENESVLVNGRKETNGLHNTETPSCGDRQVLTKSSAINRISEKQICELSELPTNSRPKRPFLKKGSGLEKFGMKAGDQKKPFNKMRPPQTAIHKRLAALRKEEAAKQRFISTKIQKEANDQQKEKHVRFVQSNNHINKHIADKVILADSNLRDVTEYNKCIAIKHADENLSKEPFDDNKYNTIEFINENVCNDQHSMKFTISKDDQSCEQLVGNNLKHDANKMNNHINDETIIESHHYNNLVKQNSSDRHLYPIQEELCKNEDNIEQNNCRFSYETQSNTNIFDIKNNHKVHENHSITPLKIPEISVQPKAKWFTVDNNNELSVIPDNSFPSIEVNADVMNSLKQLAAEKFGKVQNENAEQSTHEILKEIEEIVSSRVNPNESINNTPDLHKKLIEYLQELMKNCSDGNSCISLQSCDTTAQRELHIFEQLEQKVMNSSFSSTNSSILELLSSTPFKKTVQQQKSVHFEENRRNSGAKRELDFNLPSDESTINSEDLEERTLAELQNWPNFDENTESGSTSTQSLSIRKVVIKQNACVMTEDADFSDIRISESEEALKKRLKELDREINNFRTENSKLQKMKSEIENEKREMQKSKKKLEKELQDERIQMEFEIEEERKKLAKEKLVFERYVKDLQNRPSKKEREEISTLKAELSNVKETLKLKDTRNGTTQARLRNQLKSLEKENATLKEELEKLQKQNAKLTAAQKVLRKPSETKMLHEINKNLTKLTQDAKVVKQINQVEKSVEKLDDSLVMLEEKKQRKKKRNNYETEYRRNYSHCSETDDESDDSSSKYFRRESKKKVQQSPNKNLSSPDGTRSYFKKNSRNRYEEKQSGKIRDVDYQESNSPLNDESTHAISEKENDKNSTNCDLTTFRNLSDLSIENSYDKVFGQKEDRSRNSSLNDTQGSTSGKIESILDDGTKEIKYVNGNVKTISSDGNFIKMKYYNGDIKEMKLLDGSIKYYYAQSEMWQTTLSNGDEILEFSDGQIEKRFSDGVTEVTFPNGVVKFTGKDGKEKITYPDGSEVTVNGDEKILLLPNGQKEIHTKEHKRREYPDGTVKILYPDGLQETRYSNGRIRMKDKDGNLLMDTHSDDH